jgi:prepilin-type N-terminal cleavage/methylation domain-containing protein
MIHSKNNRAFTLIEVLLSVVIIGTVITALMSSQGVMIFSIKTISYKFSRLLLAKNLLYQTRLNGQSSAETKAQEPETLLKYSQKKATGTLGKQFRDLYREQVDYEWTEQGRKRTDQVISFIFKPEQKVEA